MYYILPRNGDARRNIQRHGVHCEGRQMRGPDIGARSWPHHLSARGAALPATLPASGFKANIWETGMSPQASILIVDDEELIRECLSLDFQSKGYATEIAANGEEACARLLEKEYDLIITDLAMKSVDDGLEVLRQAKSRDADQIVFILTGYGALNSAVEALRLEADDYLLKPYNPDELMLRVAKSLADRATRQKVRAYESILSICSECKKMRDSETNENGGERWISVEQFISKATGSGLSHGMCPDCYRRRMKQLNEMIGRDQIKPLSS
jgi:CheY-like chemotaxis protein